MALGLCPLGLPCSQLPPNEMNLLVSAKNRNMAEIIGYREDLNKDPTQSWLDSLCVLCTIEGMKTLNVYP